MSENGQRNAGSSSPSDCDLLRELLPAYSIGATDPEETQLVESLLAECPEVAAEMGEYQALADALLYSAEQTTPPAHLHDRLMAAVGAMPAAPAPSPAPALKLLPKTRGVNRFIAGFGLAAAILLVISNVYWIAQVNNLRQAQTDMLALLRGQNQVLAAASAGNARRVELVSTESGSSDVYATVLWSPQTETALLYTNRLPSLAPDRAYQLWLIAGETPVSGGLFQVDEDGEGILLFRSPQPLSSYQALGISNEPAAGSEAPTTAPLAVGQVQV